MQSPLTKVVVCGQIKGPVLGSFLFDLAFHVSERLNQAKGGKGAKLVKGFRSKQTSSTCENVVNLRVEIWFHDTQEQHHRSTLLLAITLLQLVQTGSKSVI